MSQTKKSAVTDLFGLECDAGDHVLVSMTGATMAVGRVLGVESSPTPAVVVAVAIPDDTPAALVLGHRKFKGALLSFANRDSLVCISQDEFNDLVEGEHALEVIREQETRWRKAKEVLVKPGMQDMNGVDLRLGDWVVTPINGPYMVRGRIVGLVGGLRNGAEVLTAERPENDPSQSFEGRLRTVNSPQRLLVIPPPYPATNADELRAVFSALDALLVGGWTSTLHVLRETNRPSAA